MSVVCFLMFGIFYVTANEIENDKTKVEIDNFNIIEKQIRHIQVSPFKNIDKAGRIFDEFRTIDGSNNNLNNPTYGTANGPIIRYKNVFGYDDGISKLSGPNRDSPRIISNKVGSDYNKANIKNSKGLSNMAWSWGQFLDHDVVLTLETSEETIGHEVDPICIEIPDNDPIFRSKCIEFKRSLRYYECQNSECIDSVPWRQQNGITSYIDGSNVYGSDTLRNQHIRDGNSEYLKTSKYGDEILGPLNKYKLENAGGNDRDDLFLFGDVRGNEQIGLTSLHVLFVREHNRLADIIKKNNPLLSSSKIYEYARLLNIAEMQHITYNEFLPAFFGEQYYYELIGEYAGYKDNCDASINSVFSTVAFRVGHTMVSGFIPRRGSFCEENCNDKPNINLVDAFFNPNILKYNNVGEFLAGLSCTSAMNIDVFFIRELRDLLFFGVNGDEIDLDLLSLNIMRGRDHGILDYNSVRALYGLHNITSFEDKIFEEDIGLRLKNAYDNIDDMDAIVGGLAEKHLDGSAFGELFAHIWAEQFKRLRDCDRFYYRNYLSKKLLDYIDGITLKKIIEYNTDIEGLPEWVMFIPPNNTTLSNKFEVEIDSIDDDDDL